MQFVIMDLEWNNTYAKKKKMFFNEIIEIGAVKLNSSLETVDTFSCLIRSQVGKKLRGSVKRLTHISNADLNTGTLFTKAVSDFRRWIGDEETVVFTWGDTDIRVLIENFSYLNGITTVPFLTNYCDLQACFHRKMKTPKNNQAGLKTAAEMLQIDPEQFLQHRALGDSLMTSEIFRQIYDESEFSPFYLACNEDFYKRLFFKAKVICNINNPLVDKTKLHHRCEKCGVDCEILADWKYKNQFFRATYSCPECRKVYAVGVKFKKYFDHVDVRKIVSVVEPEKVEEKEET